MCTQSNDMTRMRKAVRKSPNGITAHTSSARRHVVCKNMFAAKRLVITKTKLDLIPLHSFATSMVIPGSWKTAPARNTGVPLIRNNQLATSAEASLDAFSRKYTVASGKGTMKIRKKSGNMAEYAHLLPRKRKAPAIAKQTNDSAISVM